MPSKKDGRSKHSSAHTARDRRHRSDRKERYRERESSPTRSGEERQIYRAIRTSSSPNVPSSPRPTYSRHRSSSASGLSRERSRRKVYNIVDFGMERRASTSRLSGSRTNTTPYPSFSKAHSRESIGREDTSNSSRRPSSHDPNSADIPYNSRDTLKSSSNQQQPTSRSLSNATKLYTSEPSPTSQSRMRRVKSGSSMNSYDKSLRRNISRSPEKHAGPAGFDLQPRFSASSNSLRDAEEGKSSPNVKGSTYVTIPSRLRQTAPSNERSTSASHRRVVSRNTDSDATSIAPEAKRDGRPPTLLYHRGASPPSDPESFPRTPNGQDALSAVAANDRKQTPKVEVLESSNLERDYVGSNSDPLLNDSEPNPPPPPPPLEVAPSEIPNVDYLLRNGGLEKSISKRFIPASNNLASPTSLQSPLQNHSSKVADVQAAFAPYSSFLDDLKNVISQNGSIAVATGYKPVARKLVDHLETVFGRNISSQVCPCVMCSNDRQASKSLPFDTRVSWGEVLEFVSGRRDLPPWPPFVLPSSLTGLGLSGLGQIPPMQKLDVDVPEEYREHYIRQSKKTKQAVDKWLAGQPSDSHSPPAEVDDETLTFAMLTYLEPSQRRLFTALVRGLPSIPDARAPTPAPSESKPDVMARVGVALQRLYRLPKTPREPECGMYLLRNPGMHGVLATLAAISNQEWETLVSGRFDGVLGPGAEKQFPSMGPISSRGVTPTTRGSTPFSSPSGLATASRQTPAAQPISTPTQKSSCPGAVQVDEETEIAVLAEVEREIYTGMEALEDAFELLHVKAEGIRSALRERGASLAISARMNDKRGIAAVNADLDARLGTPFDNSTGSSKLPHAAAPSSWGRRNSAASVNYASVSDDGLDDTISLAPDDSASNIGHTEKSKHRHHRRRRSRRTPAPVDEGDE